MSFLVGIILLLWEGELCWECFHNFWRLLGPPLGPARCEANVKLDGTVAIVTGASSGIGKETVLQLAKRGAKVIMAVRDPDKGNSAADEVIEKWPPANVVVEKLDLASLKSVRSFAQRISRSERKIDYLINNAGIIHHPKAKSEDGFELHMAVNYLGHFLLTLMLLDKLKAAPDAKIVNVSSVEHLFGRIFFEDINLDKGYNAFRATGQSKLAMVLFTQELAERLKGTNVKVYSIHPGFTRTNAYQFLVGIFRLGDVLGLTWFKLSPFLGTQTTLFCLLDQSALSGGYYSNCKMATIAPVAKGNSELQKKLWDVSCKMVGVNIITSEKAGINGNAMDGQQKQLNPVVLKGNEGQAMTNRDALNAV